MIDIETMSSTHNAAVLAIGLVQFDPETMNIGRMLEVRCTLSSMRDLGRDIDPNTVEWWLSQSEEAQKMLLAEPRFSDPVAMMARVHEFLKSCGGQLCLWAKDPTFDLAILHHLADQLKVRWAGHFSREYSVRTMLLLATMNNWKEPFERQPGVKHGALSDAIHQARQVMDVMARMKST